MSFGKCHQIQNDSEEMSPVNTIRGPIGGHDRMRQLFKLSLHRVFVVSHSKTVFERLIRRVQRTSADKAKSFMDRLREAKRQRVPHAIFLLSKPVDCRLVNRQTPIPARQLGSRPTMKTLPRTGQRPVDKREGDI